MPENAQNNWRTDALQQKIDGNDGKVDNFVYNNHLTDLFIARVDKVQDKLAKAKLSDSKKRMIEDDLWEKLEGFNSIYSAHDGEVYATGFTKFLDNVDFILDGGKTDNATENASHELPFTKDQSEKWRNVTGKYLKDALSFYFTQFTPEKNRRRKEKVNEHLMVGLKYPQDSKDIRKIFENLVVHWDLEPIYEVQYKVKSGDEWYTQSREPNAKEMEKYMETEYKLKTKEIPPRIYIGDAHPFHLAFIARSMGVPLDFKFTVKPLDKKGGVRLAAAGEATHTEMTLGELIEYEKQHMLVGMYTSNDKVSVHHDAEWLLMLLNMEGVRDKKTIVGKNLLGKVITYGDVLNSVEEEVRNVKNYKISSFNTPWDLGDGRYEDSKIINKKSPREFYQSHLNCHGVHAADALLNSGTLSEADTRKYVDMAFARIYKPFLNAGLRTLNLSAPKKQIENYFHAKIEIFGHALEFYLHHKKSLRPEQLRFFQHMLKDLPKFMAELEDAIKNKKVGISLGAPLSHLYEVIGEL
ncbi:hypothetical protein HQ489_05350 [Candidatus Woesearchaeota archaeon]|nr:hypothetical protein [Candidatus Woesearchaeota archaeon]